MAVDMNTAQTPPAPVVPTGAPVDAVTSWLQAQAQSAAQQAVVAAQQALTGQAAALEARLSTVEGQVADALTKAAPAAVTAVVANLEKDPVTQRDSALIVIAGAVAACLIVLVAYLTGNPYAGKIIAGVPAAALAIALWLSRIQGVALPKRAGN